VVTALPEATDPSKPSSGPFGLEDVIAAKEVARLLLPGCQMSEWQEGWCTPEVVSVYLRGRQGDPKGAGQVLARALLWRQKYEDVLSGARVPRPVGDMRVIACGDSGHPIIYTCMRYSPSWRETSSDCVEHCAAVFEAAVRLMRQGATTLDIVMDCYGFSVLNGLNPAQLTEFLEMLKDPYRDRLGRVWIVDASAAIEILWRIAKRILPRKTLSKIRWITRSEVLIDVEAAQGQVAMESVSQAMATSRQKARLDLRYFGFPSEVTAE
jgi:hypothetical protein